MIQKESGRRESPRTQIGLERALGLGAEWNQAFFRSLTTNAKDVFFDASQIQSHQFRGAQTASVKQLEDSTIANRQGLLAGGQLSEKVFQFIRGGDFRKFLGHFRRRNQLRG